MVKALILAGVLALAACTTTPSGSFCDLANPHRPSPAAVDAMTDDEVAKMLTHNLKGQRLCGWKLSK